MTNQELANKIVAFGVGRLSKIQINGYQIGIATNVSAEQFVRDPRVAMAMMEKLHFIGIYKMEDGTWRARAGEPLPSKGHKLGDNELLPRAINEACVEALSD